MTSAILAAALVAEAAGRDGRFDAATITTGAPPAEIRRALLESVMAIRNVRCHVLGASVSCIADLEGEVSRIICPEYQELTGSCRLLRDADRDAPLSRLLERVAEGGLARRETRCLLRQPLRS
jgi:hypothetical protein